MLFKNAQRQAEFDRNGYVISRVLSPETVERLLAFYAETVADDEMVDLYESSRFNTLEKNAYINDRLRDELAPAAAEIFTDFELFGGTFMVKVPQTSTVLPLHQDWTVVDEGRFLSVFIWCALVEVGPENGGLFVLPGSHAYFSNLRSGSMPSLRIDPSGQLGELLVDIRLEPGEAIMYSDRLFHGSYANVRHEPRVIATGRVNQRGAELLYYHLREDGVVEVLEASPEFYLKEIAHLAHGRVPPGYSVRDRIDYEHRPITEADLLAQIP